MDNEILLEVKNLTKIYKIYQNPLEKFLAHLLGKDAGRKIFSLEDISFQLVRGESLGVIGDNGSGKSTLLQIVAGVLPPTKGEIFKNGKVLGLLELGIGFHPELTGRENVLAYGELLEISPSKIKEVLPQIISFAEIGDFIDQPLKTYSTGMIMRLAFATALMFKPDLLIIDEALAVGDVYFQKKCIDAIKNFQKGKGSLLFCSHSLYQITELCHRALWLHHGRCQMLGPANEIVNAYQAYQMKKQSVQHETETFLKKNLVFIKNFDLENEISFKENLDIQIETNATNSDLPYHISLSIKFPSGQGIYVTSTAWDGLPSLKGDSFIRISFPEIPLLGGIYLVHVRILDDKMLLIYDEKVKEIKVKKDKKDLGCCYFDHVWYISSS